MSSLRDRLRRQLGDPQDHVPAAPETRDEAPAGGPGPSALRERLRRLHRVSVRAEESKQAAEARRTEGFEQRRASLLVRPPTDPNRPITRPPQVEFELRGNEFGEYLHGEHHLPAGTAHGAIAVSDALRLGGAGAVLLSGDAALAHFDPTRALFFDLETTGLMGGSGNLAFLTGALRVHEDGSATLYQMLLRDPHDEPAALCTVAALLADVDWLVSFNGKSFDRNVLADRFVMSRMPPERVLELPHLDLLHPSRRLFRTTLERCNLGSLEAHRLGVHRDEATEVSGADVPERWFSYLRSGDRERLTPVVEHNALDLLTLATLAAHLDRCVRAPGAAIVEPRGLVSAARLLLARGEVERGEEVLRMLSRGASDDPVVYEALRLQGELYRRQERWVEALACWARMREANGVADVEPWRAAAVVHEHRRADLPAALALVDEFFAFGPDDPARAPEIAAMEHRRARLRRRLGQGSRASATG